MKKKTLAWAVKGDDGSYYIDTNWRRKDARERKTWPEEQIIRVEIKEVRRKK